MLYTCVHLYNPLYTVRILETVNIAQTSWKTNIFKPLGFYTKRSHPAWGVIVKIVFLVVQRKGKSIRPASAVDLFEKKEGAAGFSKI